jgi:hypothetical protein
MAELLDKNAELAQELHEAQAEIDEALTEEEKAKRKRIAAAGESLLAQQDWDWDALLDSALVDEETVLSKVDAFGEDAVDIELGVLDELEAQAAAHSESMTKEQAIVKAFNDDPELRRAYRAQQMMKARATALPTGQTVAKAAEARDDRMDYVQGVIEVKKDAMSLIHAEADSMVRDGRAATTEEATVKLLRDQPDIIRAWRVSVRDV